MAGFTTDYQKNHYREFRTKGYIDATDHNMVWDSADEWASNPTEKLRDYAMVSVLGRIGYSFDDRYFLVGSIRRDASSKLPSAKNYDWFPSVSGSWKISSEKFFRNSPLAKVFDLVKLRAGWGKVGNVTLYSLPNPTEIPLLTYPNGSLIGGNTVYGTYLETIANTDATWETTVQTSAGLDLQMSRQTRNQRRLLLQGDARPDRLHTHSPANRRGEPAAGQHGQSNQPRLGVLCLLPQQRGRRQVQLQRMGNVLDQQGLGGRLRRPGTRAA